MTFRLFEAVAALAWAVAALVPGAAAATTATAACATTAMRVTTDVRILHAIDEARRQHQLFGRQTIERNGGMFGVGYHEAEWDRPTGESTGTWERVAVFWRALSESAPPVVVTSAGRVGLAEASPAPPTAGGAPTRVDVAVREALLRAAIVDTPWSAAFISYLMKTAGFSRTEFAFSDSHVDYVRAALDTSAAEAAGQEAPHAFRACDTATTRPRAGDLLCSTRAGTATTLRFDALPAAMARAAGQEFPMHCDLVVRADVGGDAKLEVIGGNVVQSVTLSRMTLNANKVLGGTYLAGAPPQRGECPGRGQACRGHLNRRPWLVLLQFRH
ncbi:DUF2272 domain-containing protein [Ramlibacter sp.]|uniref:DUF2272 domain-containing protein n=1 Tax=Ramlibacter sp. TaxID=1917967 RepID=UPI0018546C26|nr:DUF2272 domain-containing protein [Ramlibacter sp.]MBA2676420.1 DUF2272 domain-containing protein [Ramlibacter sp.]